MMLSALIMFNLIMIMVARFTVCMMQMQMQNPPPPPCGRRLMPLLPSILARAIATPRGLVMARHSHSHYPPLNRYSTVPIRAATGATTALQGVAEKEIPTTTKPSEIGMTMPALPRLCVLLSVMMQYPQNARVAAKTATAARRQCTRLYTQQPRQSCQQQTSQACLYRETKGAAGPACVLPQSLLQRRHLLQRRNHLHLLQTPTFAINANADTTAVAVRVRRIGGGMERQDHQQQTLPRTGAPRGE